MAARDVEAGRAHVLIRLRDQVTAGLKRVERNFSNFGRSFATAGAALTAGGASALAFPVTMAANMEQLQISLEVMLGSADAAKNMLGELSNFAKATPFGLPEIASNAQLLLNYGVAANQIMPSLQALGDVSAGNADKFSRLALAFGQTQAKGRLMGQEVLQMVEAGFNPLQEIARTTGRSVADLQKDMEAGQISAAMLANAFASASGPGGRFDGMMQKQSNSAVGLYSTLMDAISFGFKPLGDAAIAILKPITRFAIGAADAFAAFMAANQGLAKAIATALIVVTVVGAVLTAVGLAAMAVGPILAGVATAISFVLSAIAGLFSPLGIILVTLAGLAVAAWHFRERLYAAFVAAAEFFRPLTDALGRIWSIFSETMTGIINALTSGNLSNAAGIAWLGFVAAAWQGVAELGTAIDAALGFLQAWIPGVEGVKTYVTSAFASIGQSILAGRWDLAAAIAMTKIKMAVQTGLSAVRFAWTSFTVGLGTIWDNIVFGIRSTWRTAVTEIAKSFIWVAEQFGFSMDGVREELDRMRAADQQADDKAKSGKDAARYAAAQTVLDQNKAREDQLRAQLADLERQSAEAYAAAGAPTIEDVAAKARAELTNAIAEAKKQMEDQDPSDDDKALRQQAGGAAKQLGKLSSAGTFSAAAAAQALGVDTTPARETARNTKKMVQLMQNQRGVPLFH